MSVTAPDHPQSAPLSDPERAKQIQQAEELLFSGPARSGFAKALFRGEFRGDVLFPYPELPPAERTRVEEAVGRGPAIRRVEHRRRRDRPRGRHPSERHRRAGEAGRAGDDGAAGVRRPGVLAVGLLPDHGGRSAAIAPRRRCSSTPTTRSASGPCSSSARPSRRHAGCLRWRGARSSRRSR